MARVNIDILGINELKWAEMAEFNSDDYYIYYCGQESLRRNGVAIMVNKRLQNAVLWCISKTTKWSLLPRQTIQYLHGNPSLCHNQQCWRSWSWWFYEDLQDLLELTPKKRCPLHYKGLECKSRKARDIWSNRQSGPLSTKWSKEKDDRVFQENALGIANTLFQQHKRRLYTRTSADGQ